MLAIERRMPFHTPRASTNICFIDGNERLPDVEKSNSVIVAEEVEYAFVS
jgi:hypothetical protein